jgi:pre-mRNA-splicing factor CWC26
MSSKADYLSKYLDSGNNNHSDTCSDSDSHQKKKKKKSKKKKRQKEPKQAAEIRVHDEEDEVLIGGDPLHTHRNSDAEEEEDEGPMVVGQEEDVARPQRGGWTREAEHSSQSRSQSRSNSRSNSRDRGGRRRHDSDSDASEPSRDKRKRYDSDSSSAREHRTTQRHDSDSEDSKSDDASHSSERDERGRIAKMASGHAAGLQKAQDFSKAEHKIQSKRKQEAAALVDQHGMGETVYRDAEGKKQDINPTDPSSRDPKSEQLQRFLLNSGRRQYQEQLDKQLEQEKLQESTFARSIQDHDLEDWKKQQFREGDPMAAAAEEEESTKVSNNSAHAAPKRIVYKGPPAPPNRFQIKPGYRWDGNHRGNGFESRLLAQKYGQAREQEKAYRWSTSDM